MLTPEEQDALLGQALLEGGAEPLSEQETAAAAEGLGPFPVTEGLPPKVDQVVSGQAAPMEVVQPTEPEAPEPSALAPPAPAPVRAPLKQSTDTERAPIAKPDPSRLVSTKPDWYDFIAPPKQEGIPNAIGAAGLGILGALLLPKKQGALKAASLVAGGLGAADSLMRAPDQDYDRRLDAAGKQAQMHRTLAGGRAGAGDSQLGWARFGLSKEKHDADTAEATRKLELEKRLGSLDSQETKAQQDALIAIGKPEAQVRQMTGAQILKWRHQFGAEARQDESQVNAVKNYNMRLTGDVEKAEMADNRKIEGEEREQGVNKQKASIKGWRPNTEQAVDPATQHAARNMAGQIDRAVRSARELQKLQAKINLVTQAGGNWFKVFGKNEDQKKILSRMQVLQNNLGAAQREIFHQGVPQQFEMVLNTQTNPDTASAMTYFTGANNWEAMEQIMAEQGSAEMGYLGYDPDEGAIVHSPAAAAPSRPKNAASEIRKAAPEGRQMVQGAGEAAGAAVEAAGRTLDIQVMNPDSKQWEAARTVTVEQYKKLMDGLKERGLGPGFVRKAKQ